MSDDNLEASPGCLVVGAFLTSTASCRRRVGRDREGGFEHGGWSVAYWDEQMGQAMEAQFGEVDALLLGRKTYQIYAAHWTNVDDEGDEVATKLNTMPKYVASGTLEDVGWDNRRSSRKQSLNLWRTSSRSEET